MSQGNLVLPVVGVFGGVTEQGYIQAAIDALTTQNSGNSAPTNAAGGTPVLGQDWIDTTSAQYRKWQVYDGTSWLPIGVIDSTNHLLLPAVGGGNGSVASAATTDIGAVNESAITVTGVTTITSFGSSAKAGWIKFLTFAGVLVLTYNATSLILPTAANITTAAGDVAAMLYLGGGNWKCVGYTKADGKSLAANSISSLDSLTHLGINAVGDATTKLNALTNRALFQAVPAASGGDGDIIIRMQKEASTDIAAHQFEHGTNAYAQAGLVGFDDYYLRTSPDNGVTWYNALIADNADGATSQPLLKYADRKRVDKGSVGTGTVTFDLHAASAQRLAVTGALTVAFTGWPASGVLGSGFLEIVNGGSAAITWPAAIQFVKPDGTLSATPPRSLQAAGTDWLTVWSRDGGTTIYARLTGNGEASLVSPAFSGSPTAPTQSSVDNSTKLATTAFVATAIGNIGPGNVLPGGVGGLGSTALIVVSGTGTGINFNAGTSFAGSLIDGYLNYDTNATQAATIAGTWRAQSQLNNGSGSHVNRGMAQRIA